MLADAPLPQPLRPTGVDNPRATLQLFGRVRAVSTVLVYSDDPAIREQILTSLGRIPSPEIGRVEYVECADGRAVMATLDAGGIDVCVLDGEAWPTGGMGLARQMKDEISDPPGVVLLVARKDDQWLAKWSRAEVVLQVPIDPFELTAAVVSQLRARIAAAQVTAAHADAHADAAPARKVGFGLRSG